MNNDIISNVGNYAFAHQPLIRRNEGVELSREILLREFNGLSISEFLEQPVMFCTHLLELVRCKALMVKHLILELGDGVYFINFTPNQIAHSKFLDSLNCFYILDISPAKIAIEVTEQSRANNPQAFYENLNIARERGHPIVVDDFGSGVSNFNHVKKLQPHIVKIDREVLCGAIDDEYCHNFLLHLVEFLKNIGSKVVIEGVETEKHLAIALKSGCDFMQGYYFARPITVHSNEINGARIVKPKSPLLCIQHL
ncbi:EAL domain-containing protein [Pseudoalteromonas nigrifaciens]|uniref:EAL domain-containing protein n=1 Tax=Pseudoalteromonas nigrifaciens TaxID=28109 RepID=UPI0017882EC6|nr:EAL domain-containing protein [Pseudoalteromonas nigrifaciens]MBE0421329.1 EAL domain-containing protein [Pseudoalteromonas nigrifaciens]